MAHHGWVPVVAAEEARSGLVSPFGRLFASESHTFSSHAISLLAGALGPLHDASGTASGKPALPAGFTFFGQFVDHDLTEFRVVGPDLALVERNPTFEQRQRVLQDGDPTTTNGRTGLFDLDSVYGLLGAATPELFENNRFRLHDVAGVPSDIVRNVDFRGGRLIADPRNDENKIIVQLHVLFERLHNKLAGPDPVTQNEFERARRRVRNVYRRIVLRDYLPRIVAKPQIQAVWERLQTGTTLYQAMNRATRDELRRLGHKDPSAVVAMPVEFAHATFRLGHTQLRNGYRLNTDTTLPLFATATSGPPSAGTPYADLRGDEAIDESVRIEWSRFFGATAQAGEALDSRLPASVFRLPPPAVAEPPISLAERNVRRGVDFGLPSGQEAAIALAGRYGPIPALSVQDLFPEDGQGRYREILQIDPSLGVVTPLWYYMLREAEVLNATGTELGPVAGLIVAETILGALAASSEFKLADQIANLALDDPSPFVPKDDPSPSIGDPREIASMVDLLRFLEEI